MAGRSSLVACGDVSNNNVTAVTSCSASVLSSVAVRLTTMPPASLSTTSWGKGLS